MRVAYNRVGPRILAILGFSLITIGTIGCMQLRVGTTWQSLQVWLVLRGLAMTPLSTLALAIVSNRQLARASSLDNVMRQVAGAIGLSVLTTYFASQSAAHLATQPFPVAATSALNDVFLVALLGCAVSTVLALFLGSDPNLAKAEQARARDETRLVRGAPQPAAGPLYRLILWTQRAKKTLGLTGGAATGMKIAPPDAAPGLISYQEVHSSTGEATGIRKRRKGASPGNAR
jgi:MFS family permease